MLNGSCLCGAVRYAYHGDFGNITVCHCADCRKAQGGRVTAAPAKAGSLEWLMGRSLIVEYESSPGKKRAFCSRCGAPLYSRREDAPDTLRLRMGTLDTLTDAVPMAHIFAADVPPWASLDDDLPRYPRHEPGRTTPSADSESGR